MTESGHGLQVVDVTKTHSYELNEKELEQLLLKNEIKDLPVVVVSVAGAYRGGKSFLLNFFLRYLSSSPDARQDGSWLGEDSEPLAGFKWRSGITATTIGVLMWSEPFISTLPSGEKVAVLLMDTQGSFDSESTVRDCSTIFALSTLLSSVQIYNVSQNIQEDDLQHLQLFSAFGKMVKDQGPKAFQVLEFLVRDWQFPWEYSYGAVGGERILQARLKITPNLPQELKDLRIDLRNSFEKVSCFLMPHPGFKVLSPKFKGNIADIDIEFRTQLKDLVASLFGPEKLLPKMINGEKIKARDLFNYFKTYMTLFNSNEIVDVTTIMKATVEAGLLSALNKARDVYEKGMDSEAGPEQLSVSAVDLQDLHRKWVTAARNSYTNQKKMGSKEDNEKYLTKLTEDLEDRLPQFVQSNLGKIQTAINKAKEAYEKAIQNISKDQILCVHPLDLQQVHKEALAAATRTFDAARKKYSNKKDDERAQFIESINERYKLLRLTNEQNNKMVVSILRMEYWQYMKAKTATDPPLSHREFTNEHEIALTKALKDFDSKRNFPNSYTEDVHRTNLQRTIDESFAQMKAMNKSKNKAALQAGVEEYDSYMKKAWDSSSECMHPEELERENERAMCRALETFRPRKQCSAGFDEYDEDETTLRNILRDRFKEMESINGSANEAAVQEAYSVYVSSMDDLCRPTLWWLLILPMLINISRRVFYHEQSKKKGFEVFFSKRRSAGYHPSDAYKETLESRMNKCYREKYTLPL